MQSKAAGQQEAEQRALVLANAVEDVLADYPTLDDAVSGLMFVEASGMSMSASEAGIDGPRIQVTVEVVFCPLYLPNNIVMFPVSCR